MLTCLSFEEPMIASLAVQWLVHDCGRRTGARRIVQRLLRILSEYGERLVVMLATSLVSCSVAFLIYLVILICFVPLLDYDTPHRKF